MAIPHIGPQPQVVSPLVDQMRATALRRAVHAELAAIRRNLEECLLEDPTTQRLRLWHQEFLEQMRPDRAVFDLQAQRALDSTVLERFTDLLERILQDPISGSPFTRDQPALLGKPCGRTYDPRTLCVLFRDHPRGTKFLSPFAQDANDPPFVTEPHPLIPVMLEWLERRRALRPPSAHIATAYAELEGARSVPLLPDRRSEARREIREREARRQREAADPELVRQGMARLSAAAAELHQEEERQRAFEVETRAELERLRNENLAQVRAELEAQRDARRQESAELNNRTIELERRSDRLDAGLNDLDGQIHQLDQSTTRVEQELAKGEGDDKDALIKAVGMAVLAAGASYGLKEVLGQAGSSLKAGVGYNPNMKGSLEGFLKVPFKTY